MMKLAGWREIKLVTNEVKPISFKWACFKAAFARKFVVFCKQLCWQVLVIDVGWLQLV